MKFTFADTTGKTSHQMT